MDKIIITIEHELNLSDKAKELCKISEELHKNSKNLKFHRTDEESKASDTFLLSNMENISRFESDIYNDSRPYNKDLSITECISACKFSIDAYYKFKDFCYSSFGGKIYFQNIWEYCHNSKTECFAYVDNLNARLENLLHKQEKINSFNKVKATVIEILKNEHSILQASLLKHFDVSEKSVVKKILVELENDSIITKEKCKNTYLIIWRDNT